MTPLRDKAIDVLTALDRASMDVVNWLEAVDALLAAGLLHDPTSEARIERAASKFYERLLIKYGAAPAWDDLSGVQRVPWIEDARQALAAADLASEADHA